MAPSIRHLNWLPFRFAFPSPELCTDRHCSGRFHPRSHLSLRRRFMALRNAGLSLTDSARALMSSVKAFGSLAQAGIKPQRTRANWRSPSTIRTIGTGWVGATL